MEETDTSKATVKLLRAVLLLTGSKAGAVRKRKDILHALKKSAKLAKLLELTHPALSKCAQQLREDTAAFRKSLPVMVALATPALQHLEVLPVRAVLKAEDGGLLAAPLPQLASLCLQRTVVGPAVAAELVEHCPNLEKLRLRKCKGLTPAVAATLRALRSLRVIELCELPPVELGALHEQLAELLPAPVEVRLQHARAPHSAAIEASLAEAAAEWVPRAVREDAAAAALWAGGEESQAG